MEEKCYLTEEDIIKNMKNVFGYEHTYFAKLIYLLLSGGYDKMKISFSTFIREFLLLKGEDIHFAFNILGFRLYDMDRDGQLNIMNLLHLVTNIDPTSMVGQEVFKLLDYYFTNNIKSKSLKRKVEVNLDLFNKIVNRSIIVEVSNCVVLIVCVQ